MLIERVIRLCWKGVGVLWYLHVLYCNKCTSLRVSWIRMIQSAHWYHSWPPRMCAGILEKWFILTFYKHIPVCRWSIILPLCRRMWILTKYVKLHTMAKLTCLHKNLHVSYSYITVMTSLALFKLKFYTITPFYRKHL